MVAPKKKDVEAKLQEAYRLLQENRNDIPDRMYRALEGISSVFYAWKVSKGAKGWSSTLVNTDGKAIFTKQQRVLLEEAFNTYGPMFDEVFDEKMVGGASMSNVQQGPTSSLVQTKPAINPEDVSIDKLYHYVTTTADQYDEQWKSISNSLGIVRAVEAQDYRGVAVIPMVPPVPVPYYILGKAIFPFLTMILDSIRLGLGNPGYDLPMVRVSLSMVLCVIDLIRGDWQTALLSSMGIFSSSGVVVGIFGKLVRNAWLFIAPDLQKQLRDDIYRSSKSMCVGFLLWAFSIFSPDAVRLAVNTSFDKMREIIEQFNQKSQDAEDRVQSVAEKSGVKVTFPKIPLTIVPSMDDIQNLQTIARVPEVYCSPEVQDIIQPILLVPPLRLVLELLNIPTVPEMVREQCKSVDTSSLSKAVAEKATPEIEILPGGILDKAQNAANKAKNTVKNTVKNVKNTVNSAKNITRKKRRNA
jgi:gas vesicle protein